MDTTVGIFPIVEEVSDLAVDNRFQGPFPIDRVHGYSVSGQLCGIGGTVAHEALEFSEEDATFGRVKLDGAGGLGFLDCGELRGVAVALADPGTGHPKVPESWGVDEIEAIEESNVSEVIFGSIHDFIYPFQFVAAVIGVKCQG